KTARAKNETLSDIARNLAGCLLAASKGSDRRALTERIKEAVKILVAAAQGGADSLRLSVRRAADALGGLIPVGMLFTASLQQSFAAAKDEQATAFAATAGKCSDIDRQAATTMDLYLGEVARCLAGSNQQVLDTARGQVTKSAVEKLGE